MRYTAPFYSNENIKHEEEDKIRKDSTVQYKGAKWIK
jgi:hypothetical protein